LPVAATVDISYSDRMTGAVTNWFKENQVLIIGLIGQAIVAGIYMVNLEARVSILEVRGSPHLQIIDNRLTVLESRTNSNAERIDRLVDKLTK
jgi:hypothetical protein